MSCTIETIISCDRCGDANNGDDRHNTAKQIRASRAADFGWVFRGGKDYCPKCAAALKSAPRKPRI